MKINDREIRIPKPLKIAAMILASLIILLFIYRVFLMPQKIYYTCDDLWVDGIYVAKEGDPYYQPAMDRDGDGVACE